MTSKVSNGVVPKDIHQLGSVLLKCESQLVSVPMADLGQCYRTLSSSFELLQPGTTPVASKLHRADPAISQ